MAKYAYLIKIFMKKEIFKVKGPVAESIYTAKLSSDKSYLYIGMTPYIVIRILLTSFPMLYFRSHNYSVTTNLYFLILSPFSPIPATPFPSLP